MNETPAGSFHQQELRLALVMNGGVSLAIWIGGVTQEINRLVRGESVYGRIADALYLKPRVDIVSGTSAGGINGALLALAMSQGKPLDPLRDIWLDQGDILTLLRKPMESDPPSLLDGGYFYQAMVDGFQKVRDQQGTGMRPPASVPIELTLTTTVLCGEVTDFPDDAGTVIRDVTHRGLLKFNRGPDLADDPFAGPDIVLKLGAAARSTASFPGAFEPFYLPGKDEKVSAGGHPVPCLMGHANFNNEPGKEWRSGRYVVDGGVLDNNPLESAIDAVFRQRAEGEVRRVLAYVVPDPGHIPDPPPQQPGNTPSILSTVAASLVSIPRVESVSDQLRAIAEHNQRVSRQRDTRLLVARSLEWEGARKIAEAMFNGYRLRRVQSAADYIAEAIVKGAARHRDASGHGIALGRRARQRIADALPRMPDLPWLPERFDDATDEQTWRWGLITLENVMGTLLDLLRQGMALVPVRRGEASDALWRAFAEARRTAYDLVAELTALRRRDLGHWESRGRELAPRLAELEQGGDTAALDRMMREELRIWVQLFDDASAQNSRLDGKIEPPRVFAELARKIGTLFLSSLPLLRGVRELVVPGRDAEKYADLNTLLDFFDPAAGGASAPTLADAWLRLLTQEVVHYAFGANPTREQHLELIQFSANAPTAFNGPNRLEQKLAGVQMAHFGAFYKRSWRINDWMFGRLDGAERLIHVLLDPGRMSRLYGSEPPVQAGDNVRTVLTLLRDAVFAGVDRQDDAVFLTKQWQQRLPDMERELAFLEPQDGKPGQLPESLPECGAMVRERVHLDILRQELPALANAVGDDEMDGADLQGNGPKFLKRFRAALFPDGYKPGGKAPRIGVNDGLPTEQLVELFKGAKVGEEKVLKEVGTDRFTLLTTRAAAVGISALSGKGSGLKSLGLVFKSLRAPLIALDILVQALLKRGRIFVSLYAMAMAASLVVLLSGPLADATWPAWVVSASGVILFAGLFVLLRRHLALFLGLVMLALVIGVAVPFIHKCLGS